MDMELGLFESGTCRERLQLTASILDGESAAFYDVVRTARMVMPG